METLGTFFLLVCLGCFHLGIANMPSYHGQASAKGRLEALLLSFPFLKMNILLIVLYRFKAEGRRYWMYMPTCVVLLKVRIENHSEMYMAVHVFNPSA